MFFTKIDLRSIAASCIKEEVTLNHHFLQSSVDQNIGYLVGIIDYFQLYTMQKAAERFFKRVMKCNPNLDTSSQPPTIYSERFIKWTNKIFTSEGDQSTSEVELTEAQAETKIEEDH